MTDIDIVVSLPEELVKRAQAKGVLNNARIAMLLQAEIERLENWQSLDQSLEAARAAFREDHAGLSEDEILAMIDEIVDEVRREDNDESS